MKTLALANGDLVVAPGGHTTLTAAAKIRQDMALALGEPLGNDRFHPEWGSVLPTYIGQPMDAETEMQVQSEVARIVEQQMAVQQRDIAQDSLKGRASRYDAADIIVGIEKLTVSVRYDTILVTVALVTQAGVRINIKRTVNI
jgi:phage baseplate assembly protein W